MTSPAHRAALGFLRGGLIAVVSVVIAPVLGSLAPGGPAVDWFLRGAKLLLPVTGFAIGGVVGGGALNLGRRGAAAFGCGGGAAGLVLVFTSPNLQGLTGFENPLHVVSYAVGTSAAAFAAAGLVGSLIAGRGGIARVTAAFAIGGAIGGLIGVVPFLVQRLGSAGWGEVWVLLTMACSAGSIVLPFGLGGSCAARAWSAE